MNIVTRMVLAALCLAACGQSATPDPNADAAQASDTAATVDVAAAQDASVTVDVAARVDAGTTDAPVAPNDERIADAATPADSDVRDVSDAGPPPTFETIYETILRPRCTSCHGGGSTGSALSMPDAPTAFMNLVNVHVQSRWIETCASSLAQPFTNLYRVRPNDPEASMLIFMPRCYVRDALHMTVTEPERAMIRAWINAGATN